MHPKLKQTFDGLQADSEKLFASLSSLNPDQLNHSPAPGTWSINQILSHLLAAERLSLIYIKKKARGIETYKNTGVWGTIKLNILILSQRFPFKFKAPQTVIQHAPTGLTLPEIIKQWQLQRQDLKEFLETVADRNIQKGIFRHHVAGMLNIAQAMIFFREHCRHHLPQIKRLLKK